MTQIHSAISVWSSTLAIALALTGALASPSLAQIRGDWGDPDGRERGAATYAQDRGDWGDPDGRERGAATYVFSPPGQEAPGRRMAGEQRSRGDEVCPEVAQPITALVPSFQPSPVAGSNSAGSESVWGLTTADHPTFWFYIPYTLDADLPLQFVLLDADFNPVYETIITLSTTSAGIIEIALPPSAPVLEVGQRYNWVFMAYCSMENPLFAEGWIERTSPDPAMVSQLQQASPEQQGDIYASHGIWFDALTHLAELRRMDPQNRAIASQWHALLESVGLEALADEPLVP